MSRTSLKRSLAALAAAAAAAAILYNGHAGLGSAPTAAIKDGTSNTLIVGVIVMADMGGQFRAAGR
jgi:hypothetical protein